MRADFRDRQDFFTDQPYRLLPFRTGHIPGVDRVLLAADTGEHIFLTSDQAERLFRGGLCSSEPEYRDLLAKHFIYEGSSSVATRLSDAKIRTRKSFIGEGQTLHLFVVTLRCDHSCAYCQVSRQISNCSDFDMTEETARHAVDLLFGSPSPNLTVEFQGGEPLLAFHRIRQIVEHIEVRNKIEQRAITYTLTSTLHHLTDEILEFLRIHNVLISTSLDGPADLHDANRPLKGGGSHARTLDGLQRARSALGHDKISALTTLTRRSLKQPEAVIDEYVGLGFRSIFLRPLSPYGFAKRSAAKLGYPMHEFVAFYEKALAYLLSLNTQGIEISEAYTGLLLEHVLTPFPSSYVDLRSPSGAGLNTLVYNYDGGVYASDEGRMLAEMGDDTFRLGRVSERYETLMASPAMESLGRRALAETLQPCADCAFVPFCGADPIQAHATGQPFDRPSDSHCDRHMGLFRILFRYLAEGDPEVMRIFLGWALRKSPDNLRHGVV